MLKGSLVFHLVLGDRLAGKVRIVAKEPDWICLSNPRPESRLLETLLRAPERADTGFPIPEPLAWTPQGQAGELAKARLVLNQLTPSRRGLARCFINFDLLRKPAAFGRPTIQGERDAEEA